MAEANRKAASRRVRLLESTCQALEKRMAEMYRDHEDISPFVEWVLKIYLNGGFESNAPAEPARTVTLERIERDSKRKTA